MRIFLIGNAPFSKNISHLIHNDDYIVRFNLPNEVAIKLSGDTTDAIFLANTDYLVKKNIQSGLLTSSVFRDRPKIILPYHKDIILKNFPTYKIQLWKFIKYKKSNYNNDWLISQLQKTYCKVETLIPNDYEKCLNLLEIDNIPISLRTNKKAYIPSTGFIALNYYLNHPKFKNLPIVMHGFSFKGWDGHAWDKEKAYIATLHKLGKVSFIDGTILK